ncbi:MAG: stage V sporulation protein AD [Clostridia bacterium]|nr:stage V sporulation protein AD [Clostridia bacterium]
MQQNHRGKAGFVFSEPPTITGYAAVVGKKEAEGPLGGWFDIVSKDTHFGQSSWEAGESEMQRRALSKAVEKAGMGDKMPQAVFSGDLLNQCIGSSFALSNRGVPVLGLYGACSTMAEALLLAAMTVSSGACETAAALTSSHFASAERQYRFPLAYGGQRTPTAQWTVTGSGCAIVCANGNGPYLQGASVGTIVDMGIKDANNMGAAMAPAAYQTIRQHFEDFRTAPEDYDLIVTGDLGLLGKQILLELFDRDGVDLSSRYDDCGAMIFDTKGQDVHMGGSGCGCGASVLCGHLLKRMANGSIGKLLFCGTGAMLSPTSTQQGKSIPAVCHAVSITAERGAPWTM